MLSRGGVTSTTTYKTFIIIISPTGVDSSNGNHDGKQVKYYEITSALIRFGQHVSKILS